jgi:hypothetical protein
MDLIHVIEQDLKNRYFAKLDLLKQYREDLDFWDKIYDENCFTDEKKTRYASEQIAVINEAVEQLKNDMQAMRKDYFSREELAEMKKQYEAIS